MIDSTGMELVAGLDTQIFVIFLGVVVALGCTLVAFLVDYLKGKNERLREQVLEMTVRQEERARHPQLAVDSTAVLSAIAQVGKNLENVVRGALIPENQNGYLTQDGATPEAPFASIPVFQPRPSATHAAVATLATEVHSSAPVFGPGPAMSELAAEGKPVAEPELTGPAPMAATLTSEPDWRQASWAALPIPASDPELPFGIEPVSTPATEELPTVSTTVTSKKGASTAGRPICAATAPLAPRVTTAKATPRECKV